MQFDCLLSFYIIEYKVEPNVHHQFDKKLKYVVQLPQMILNCAEKTRHVLECALGDRRVNVVKLARS